MNGRGIKTFTITSQPFYDQYNQCYTFSGLTNGSTIDIYNTQLGNIYYGRFTLSSAPTYSSGRYTITGAYVGSALENQQGLFSNNLYFSVVGSTPTLLLQLLLPQLLHQLKRLHQLLHLQLLLQLLLLLL